MGRPREPGRRFQTTRWSVVLRAVTPDTDRFRDAFSAFWERYHEPLRAFLRAKGYSPDATDDLLQGFFTSIVEGRLRHVDPGEGRFRNYLLRSLEHYVSTVKRSSHRLKRGGGIPHLPLEIEDSSGEQRYTVEPITVDDPLHVYERAWAVRVIDLALEQLEARYRSREDLVTFEALKDHLAHERGEESYEGVAQRLGRTSNTVKVQASRMRDRLEEELRRIVAETVGDDADIGAEIRYLFAALEREPPKL